MAQSNDTNSYYLPLRFRSAQRCFIISEMRFRAAGLM
jgi:hypothetical protein